MQHRIRNRQLGFTLTELAIVLAVVGVLAAGLFNLISSANTQTRDAAAASQQQQMISSVKAFLSSAPGQLYMEKNSVSCGGGACGTSGFSLPLPSDANCNDYGDVNWRQFCSFLPQGFYSTTTNSYSEKFSIQILRDSTPNPGGATPPQTYSFMILAWSPSAVSDYPLVSDSSGARIAALIGGDGGFIYTNSVCNPSYSVPDLWACGSYGSWSANVILTSAGNYGFPVAQSLNGDIVSRTYVSPESNITTQWLARQQVPPGDSTYTLNTMTMPEYLGTEPLVMGNPTVGLPIPSISGLFMGAYSTSPTTVTTGGETIYLEGGTIQGIGNSNISMVNPHNSPPPNPIIDISSGCTAYPLNGAGCPAAIFIPEGDVDIAGGILSANTLYAGTFIYQTGGPSSDIRLKSNIHRLVEEDALDGVMKLKPVSFNFKADGKPSLGVIAQDIEKIYPELVINGGDGMKAVNYNGLIAPLIGAVQELKKENDELREQIKQESLREDKLEREFKGRPLSTK